ncbi:Polysialic acid transport protein KpsD [Thalassocella blandensis]|nr:Polysialic acid transport protein KpsD [Thalassocella blandensis]
MFRTLVLFLTFCLSSSLALAQAPTQQQIEQFKRLSPEQQRALAESMGIDISQYVGTGGSATTSSMPSEPVSGRRQSTTLTSDNGDEIEKITAEGTDLPSLREDNEEEDTGDEPLKLFGYDIFQYGAESFTPATDIPIPADYILGPGDTIVVQLYGKENTTHTLTLNREGNVNFPNIGPVSLSGLSFDYMKNKIDEIVREQMIGVKSSVTMGSLRTIRIFVLGEAQIPGSYVVGSLSTMTNAIFASGGITKIGSLRNVQLKRAGKVITTLDLYELLLNGDTSKDSRLLPGDVIFIPPIGKTVGLAGPVKRPAIYELKHEKTVEQVIALAGGLLPTAYVPASKIERITDTGEKTLVNLDLSTEKGRTYKIQDADVLRIYSTLDTMRDIVKLEGHVKRPGGFAWRENIRFTDIVPTVDDLLPNPDINIGLILREARSTRKLQVYLFSPKDAFASPKGALDPILKPRDSVMMFNYEDDRSESLAEIVEQMKTQADFNNREQVVHVFGSIRFPGIYPATNDILTARELISLAGGLSESALGSGAEITRYAIDQDRNRVVMHMDVDLNTQNPEILPGDTLRIKQIPLWQKRESVEILGEVLYPGVYDILQGETLLDVIGRAGGLTQHAYAEGAIFSREELRALEQERLESLKGKIESDIAAARLEQSQNAKDINEAEAEEILKNIDRSEALGRMVIDLPAILNNPNSFDFELADGDLLQIPRFKPSVTVVGEVQHPTSHFFNKQYSLKDYLEMSGGTKQNADKKRIYVVKANGRVYTPQRSVWFKSRSKRLEPGDTIIVPIDTDRVDKLTMWGSVTTIMYQAALGVAAIGSL